VNIPQTGSNQQKEKFFREIAQAFEFLALYYSISAEEQLELMQALTKLQGKRK
jgi:hypothetical protein